ncbi:MAG: chorismate synthase [Chloroflexi bacterium]|nr:chorismate synthase [Chloroflexota bacterium]
MPLRYLTAGESHGPRLTTIIEGLPAGLEIHQGLIDEQLLRRRRGYGAGPRMKMERDKVRIVGGVLANMTTGAPVAIQIENDDHRNWVGKEHAPLTIPRPGHADLTAAIKYGYRDLRFSLERASARETAARVAVGALCRHFLAQFAIVIGGYVRSIADISAPVQGVDLAERSRIAETNEVRSPDEDAAQLMIARIKKVIRDRNTLGGTIEVFATGLPPGLGSHVHWDRRLDSRLGAVVLGVQAIKGIEFGSAFENTKLPGTEIQDAIRLSGDDIVRPTNRAGGLEGGITNGNPLLIRAAMKPIATTLTPQPTVDLLKREQVPTQYERSDFCPVPRAVPIIEAVVAIELAKALLEKLGGDTMEEMKTRFASLRQARLSDLVMDESPRQYWSEVEG